MEPMDLMNIIPDEEQIALILWYWRGVQTLIMHPIIIAEDTWWPDAF